MKLRRDDVTCIARLPKVLKVKRIGTKLLVNVQANRPSMQIAITTPDGGHLLERGVQQGTSVIDIAEIIKGLERAPKTQSVSPHTCMKLLSNGRLIDAVQMP